MKQSEQILAQQKKKKEKKKKIYYTVRTIITFIIITINIISTINIINTILMNIINNGRKALQLTSYSTSFCVYFYFSLTM